MSNAATGRRRLGVVGALCVILALHFVDQGDSTELTQFFPAVPAGQVAPEAESGWRISWDVLRAGEHG